MASSVLTAARNRQVLRSGQSEARIEWMIKEVVGKMEMSFDKRVKLATELVKSKIIRNISKAVVKETGPRGGMIVTQRSVAGEFPSADTSLLMKTIFSEVKSTRGMTRGYIGTPLDYGVILELRRNRSFLVRTLNENRTKVMAILNGPIR